jgi:hypothetical protein
MSSDVFPRLSSFLRPGEKVLIAKPEAATTVFEGSEGFLIFRTWERKTPHGWRVVSEFFLGSVGREGLREVLDRGLWRGVILAEAATCFANGSTEIKQPRAGSLTAAKAWVISRLSELLEAEEQVSQALVMGPGGRCFDLSPATWPHLSLDGSPPLKCEWNETQLDV